MHSRSYHLWSLVSCIHCIKHRDGKNSSKSSSWAFAKPEPSLANLPGIVNNTGIAERRIRCTFVSSQGALCIIAGPSLHRPSLNVHSKHSNTFHRGEKPDFMQGHQDTLYHMCSMCLFRVHIGINHPTVSTPFLVETMLAHLLFDQWQPQPVPGNSTSLLHHTLDQKQQPSQQSPALAQTYISHTQTLFFVTL